MKSRVLLGLWCLMFSACGWAILPQQSQPAAPAAKPALSEQPNAAKRKRPKQRAAASREGARAQVVQGAQGERRVADAVQDGGIAPRMVVVPKGCFMMGNRAGDEDERRVHQVCFARPFAVGVYEVTFDDYDRYVQSAHVASPADNGWGRGRRPVINVSWDEADGYVRWLSRQTGKHYRLLSEAEWEYAARGGTQSNYWFGDAIGVGKVNCAECGSTFGSEKTAPVGSYAPNAFGLYDVHGNVQEWVEDCYHDSYVRAPIDGSVWPAASCVDRVLRGGSWDDKAAWLRSSVRNRMSPSSRSYYYGFRVARDL